MNPSFWRGKRVFLTGHTGFKGSWLSLWLQALEAELTGFALPPPTDPNLFEEAGVGSGMRSVIGDVRDLSALAAALRESRAEIVFHLAAQPLVRHSYADPVETYSTNLMGTVHLLEAVRLTPGVRAVVNVTTDKCYENREWLWSYRENERLGGRDPYSSSKACAEMVSAAYRSSFFEGRVAVATARAGNVIGGGDWAGDRLLPDIVKAFLDGRAADIRNPHAVRPWQHVLEPLRGYLALAERLFVDGQDYAEGWNFGPNDEDAWPVARVVERTAELLGENARWHVDAGQHPQEAGLLRLDSAKARQRLGWRPALRLDEALQLTIDWYRKRHAGADVRDLTRNQMRQYQSLLER